MVEAQAITLLPFLLLLLLSSAAALLPISVNPRPQELRSFKIRDPNSQVGGNGCSYTVSIKTSCSSPRYTRDAISLAFGDAYRNEVYAPRLDDPSSRTFERCSTDTFKLAGPCGYGICYLYVYRQGRDGWTPEWVKVVDPRYPGRPITFSYGSPIPGGVWYGFNHCPRVTGLKNEKTGVHPISKM